MEDGSHQKNCFGFDVYQKQCYLPHRYAVLKNSPHYIRPNWPAIFLWIQSSLIQIFIPIAMINGYVGHHEESYAPLTHGEVIQKICPVSAYDLMFGEGFSTHEINHFWVIKIAGALSIAFLKAQLLSDAEDEWDNFGMNWSNKALPKLGLIFSRIQNAFVFMLIMVTTVILFLEDPTFTGILLNCVAMQFILQVDDLITGYIKVAMGIATENDAGRKLFLSYIASGIRKDKKMEKFLNLPFIKSSIQLLRQLLLLFIVWTFMCV